MNASPSPLRERRRRQTARDIQHATLLLAQQHGYPRVTTEMIAAEAGISLRTFFNYYHNQEAAVVGPPPNMDAAARTEFASGQGSLIADFARLILAQLELNSARKETIRAIDDVVRQNPELEPVFIRTLSVLTDQLAGALAQRFGPGQEPLAQLLADVLTRALSRAFRDWGHSASMTPQQAVHEMTQHLGDLGRVLSVEGP